SKDEKLETQLTSENAEQLYQNAAYNGVRDEQRAPDDPSSIHFITLNSSKNPGKDSDIVKKSRNAITTLGDPNMHSNACVNAGRRVEKNDYPGIENQLEQIATYINSNAFPAQISGALKNHLVNYLQHNKGCFNYTTITNLLKNSKEPFDQYPLIQQLI